MSLTQLHIYNVRNLQEVKLHDLGEINVFSGHNGSGKTSVLEAIHILGLGRSFRGSSAKALITHEKPQCTVFGQGAVSLGVRRLATGESQIKVAGKPASSVTDLIGHLPLQVINADSFDLLVGSPRARRQYLDWGVFHVEHRFYPTWRRFQRGIKQRNKILRRDKIENSELSVWSNDLAEAGDAIHSYREAYFLQLVPRFHTVLSALAPELEGLEIRYRRGWDKSLSYADALAQSQKSDLEHGYTHVGPQRGDLRVLINGYSAADTLSRGQQKLVVCALKLAQGQALEDRRASQPCSYLVDDLPSELDSDHCRKVCELLAGMRSQVFITSVEADEITDVWPAGGARPLTMFHVEHGKIAAFTARSDEHEE